MQKNITIDQLIHQLNASQWENKDLSQVIAKMQHWRDTLKTDFTQNFISPTGLNTASKVSQMIAAYHQHILAHTNTWDQQWSDLLPAQSLSDLFENKILLLIFGKFNAGKSSLCNVLADLFRLNQQTVKHFYLDQGEIVYNDDHFCEGATETTVRLQGMCLGEKLILLDTPGLHSANAENSALTKYFIDCADGVLWLSSSSSPGQVQELESLGNELQRNKPLLPIITRSDQFEEDEVDGELCTVLCNKSSEQRAIQEQDVYERSMSKMLAMQVNPHLLKQPISISTHMIRQLGFETEALSEAGFTKLIDAIFKFIAPALAYKQRKSAEFYLHYLQEKICLPLQEMIEQDVYQIKQTLSELKETLLNKQKDIHTHTLRSVIPELSTLFKQYESTQDLIAIQNTINEWTKKALSQHFSQQLSDDFILYLLPDIELQINPNKSYEIIADDANTEHLISHERLFHEVSNKLDKVVFEVTQNLIDQHLHDIQLIENHLINLCDTYTLSIQKLDAYSQSLRQETLEPA